MKTCPYCAELVQDAAVKCRYCREVFGERQTSPLGRGPAEAVEPKANTDTVLQKSPLEAASASGSGLTWLVLSVLAVILVALLAASKTATPRPERMSDTLGQVIAAEFAYRQLEGRYASWEELNAAYRIAVPADMWITIHRTGWSLCAEIEDRLASGSSRLLHAFGDDAERRADGQTWWTGLAGRC